MRKRSGLNIMRRLIILVAPLWHVMLLAIVTGVIGFACSIFIPIFAGYALVDWLEFKTWLTIPMICVAVLIFAVIRGVLRYVEQSCNHYIAFKLLAIIRDKVFQALRRLAPAKLEGKDKGNLISIITSDIELLEVFYAHTISPIAIASIVSIGMTLFIGQYSALLGAVALLAYIVVGVVLPLITSRIGRENGAAYRETFGELNSFYLDSLRGMKETIQFDGGEKRLKEINERSQRLGMTHKKLSEYEGMTKTMTDLMILLFSSIMLFTSIYLYYIGTIGLDGVIIATIAMMSSFGPVVALSNLANNLLLTLASGERVLNLLDEAPVLDEVTNGVDATFEDLVVDQVDFAYGTEPVLNNVSMSVPKHAIIGVQGRSGSGKSTLLKLMMRFWDPTQGQIRISGSDLRTLNTSNLRGMQSLITQETQLFHDTILNNIKIANPAATHEQVVKAAKKAAIHDFIMSLPDGYETNVGELGDQLSGGERQRIGVARAFLYDAPLILMDEPTSNLDSLNEGIILKSLKEEGEERTVVLVSHRKSTMNIADRVISVESGRIS